MTWAVRMAWGRVFVRDLGYAYNLGYTPDLGYKCGPGACVHLSLGSM
jgi:hypothetical protein